MPHRQPPPARHENKAPSSHPPALRPHSGPQDPFQHPKTRGPTATEDGGPSSLIWDPASPRSSERGDSAYQRFAQRDGGLLSLGGFGPYIGVSGWEGGAVCPSD